MKKTILAEQIEQARVGTHYQNYLAIRDRVLEMVEEAEVRGSIPSCYWSEEVEGFEYMFDASPLLVEKLREHCHHLTGIRSYDYRAHHSHVQPLLARKLQALQNLDRRGLFVPESLQLGGFGHEINSHLVNVDTLKFYEVMIALDHAGMLDDFYENSGEGKVVLEIGGGWGGFAYQFMTIFPKATFMIIDLPATLLFSAVYVNSLFPDAQCFIYGDAPVESLTADYEFIALPHFALSDIELVPDLAINMVSFQEMTTAQVDGYAQRMHQLGCERLYSLNRDRSRYNDQLSSVNAIVSRYYDMVEIPVLPVPYTELTLSVDQASIFRRALNFVKRPENLIVAAKRILAQQLNRSAPRESTYIYKHLAGRRRQNGS